ncbi:hypothetical protein GCM10008959_09710 [Deinococcus seoulensis]|uniref:Uncharacterized protein n=2 Tax=Deinococcus TaxID=1298 RepID=A0ABQ2RMR4_9DEIO|nr:MULTISPECIES: hypothetical protein [Deinococcus]GGR50513.1 hypothetical protein GCM10008959_09710 [Deinococcus seoulensis]GGS32116.1 hypothetical protein GCM10008961_24820 [Deinococcus knuensis]
MHVPTLPSGTYPIGNYQMHPDPGSGRYRIHVQCAGHWHPVTAPPDQESLLVTLLQAPFPTVQDGWIVAARSPLGGPLT